ncbi:MAG: hypothetical protein KGR26_08405 [Cyanobacteria bacterium REEB65]|nr:hypothetical protein [Cyanobacteria bacterium REEB65]
MPKVEPIPTFLPPEILAKVGYDVPPAATKLTRRQVPPRDLRQVRKQMTYHWF